jgi:hypothetical protein
MYGRRLWGEKCILAGMILYFWGMLVGFEGFFDLQSKLG